MSRRDPAQLRARFGAAFAARLSPEHTRRPTLLFLIARSALGFARWRVQRELWRRDVARFTPGG